MQLCVSNGRIVDPAQGIDGIGTLWAEDGLVTGIVMADGRVFGQAPGDGRALAGAESGAVGADSISAREMRHIDAAGKWVTPGLIDLHVHFREPGQEYKEDIASGCRAAARGGFTTVCCMPNTVPVIDCAETVMFVDRRAAEAAALNGGGPGVRVLPVGAVTAGQRGECLADIKGMAEAKTEAFRGTGKGICAISEDGKSVASAALMLAGMKATAACGLPVFSHAEDPSLPGTSLGEELMVARDIMLAKEAGCRLHFCHVSTAGSVELIRRARAAGLPVSGEAAPHHFALDSRDEQGNGNRKMNPPLRRRSDVEALRQALTDGTLTAIATDHAPHHSSEKDVPFAQAANGVVGLETAFGVSFTQLVAGGGLTPRELIRLMSTGPAEILGIEAGSLAPGRRADIAVLDVEQEYPVRAEDFLSKGKNSPFLGMWLRGRAVCTVAAGCVIWEEKSL